MSDRMNSRAQVPATLESLEGGSAVLAESIAKSWDKFSQWVCCMCVVTFDLELGQAIEVRRNTVSICNTSCINIYEGGVPPSLVNGNVPTFI